MFTIVLASTIVVFEESSPEATFASHFISGHRHDPFSSSNSALRTVLRRREIGGNNFESCEIAIEAKVLFN